MLHEGHVHTQIHSAVNFYGHRKIAGDFFYHPAYVDCYHFARFLAENFDDGKARSIDSTADAEQIFRAVLEEISKYFEIIKNNRLEPFQRKTSTFPAAVIV